MNLFYRPKDAVLGDVIPFYDNGLFKPFFLKNTRGAMYPGNEDGWHMLTTRDHIHFTEHPTHIQGGTGSVIKVDGTYHLFYCTFTDNPRRQVVRHAVSSDLDRWITIPDEILTPDGKIYIMEEWRDPFVFWNEETHEWWMLVAAHANGLTERGACVGLCVSQDLHSWEHRQPLYKPMECGGACECPDLFKWGDWYYLLFSNFADRFQTVYRMSKSMEGPWITPVPDDCFDSRAFYAAKTGTDGKSRFVYAWNPTKELPRRNFNPENRISQDVCSFDWGGNLVVHQLFQREDGTLRVAPEPHVDRALHGRAEISIEDVLGENTISGNSVSVSSADGFAGVLLNHVPQLCKFEANMKFTAGTQRFGIAVQVDENYDTGYYFYLEPHRNRIEYVSGIRFWGEDGEGGKMFPYAVELERPFCLKPDTQYHIRIFIQDSLFVVYLNDEIAMDGRMYDYKGRRFGLFAIGGKADFSNIEICTE